MINATKYVWMDGSLVDWDNAKVHILTHSLHYGAAVFEGLRFYNTAKGVAVFRLPDHIGRLFNSSKLFDMKIPFSKTGLERAVMELVRANGIKEGYVRPIVYFGYGVMGLRPRDSPVNVAIASWPWGKYLEKESASVKISKWRRISRQATDPNAKVTGNYVNSILAAMDAAEGGFDEALMLDADGFVAEGPGENVFIVKGGKLVTPPIDNVLPGITRDSVITLAKDAGIGVEEKFFTQSELYEADEAFFTGTAAEITPISRVDGKNIGDGGIGDITRRIAGAFSECTAGKNEKHPEWLGFVSKD